MVAKVPGDSFNPHWWREKLKAGHSSPSPSPIYLLLSSPPLVWSPATNKAPSRLLSVPTPSTTSSPSHSSPSSSCDGLITSAASLQSCLSSCSAREHPQMSPFGGETPAPPPPPPPAPPTPSFWIPPHLPSSPPLSPACFWMVSVHSLAHFTIALPLELPGECLSQQLHWQLFSKVHLIYLI